MSNYGFTVPTNGYDDEDRLVGWERADSNLDQSWNLSLVGDWDSFTENSTTQNRTHGNAHEILTADSQSVTHDTKGNQTGLPSNLTTSTSGLTLEWDFENKLYAADVDGTSGADILQKFDALGRRISRDDGTTNTIFVPSGQQTIADYTAGTAASSPTYRYVYASYIDEPVMRAGSTSTAKLYYHRNQQYSVTALTDTTGTISERYAYDAYGKVSVFDSGGTSLPASAYGNRYTYTGREWDGELGLYHYRARMYSPDTGRFVSRDPIGYLDGTNLFQIVRSNPILFLDPYGQAFVHPDDISTLEGCAKWRREKLAELFGPLASHLPLRDRIELAREVQKKYMECYDRCIGPTIFHHHYMHPIPKMPTGNMSPWFDKRFPKTVAAMKSKSISMTSSLVCNGNETAIDSFTVQQIRPGHDDSSNWPYHSFFPPERPKTNEDDYGDKPQTPWDSNARLGTYTWKVIDLRITNSGHECCKVWSARLIAVDDLGTGPPDPWLASCICRTAGFRPHTKVILAEYPIQGKTCCTAQGAK